MLFCLAKTDDVRLIASLCIGHMYNDAAQPAEQIDPLLAVGLTVVLPSDDRAIEDCLATHEIQTVDSDFASSLRLVPGHHDLIVATDGRVGLMFLEFRALMSRSDWSMRPRSELAPTSLPLA